MSPDVKRSKQKGSKAASQEAARSWWKALLEKGDGRFWLGSLVLHLVVAVMLLASWSCSEPVKRHSVPSNMPARILSAAELAQLREKKATEQRAIDEAKRKKAQKLKQEKLKKQKALKKKQEEARKKKAAQKKKEAEKKAEALRIKKAVEKKRKEEKQRKEAHEKQQEKKRLEAAKKEKEIAEEKRLQDLREKRLAERLAQAEAQEVATEAPSPSSSVDGPQALNERDRFVALIRGRIEDRWHIPPKSRGMFVVLRIRLLPSGESAGVEVVQSSGSTAFDNAALNAVRSVSVFPVPDDPALFEAYFRQLNMSFTPPDE